MIYVTALFALITMIFVAMTLVTKEDEFAHSVLGSIATFGFFATVASASLIV